MCIFDKYLLKKDNGVRRRVEIDISLYSKLEELVKIYDASINKMVNIAIIELIKTKRVEYMIDQIKKKQSLITLLLGKHHIKN